MKLKLSKIAFNLLSYLSDKTRGNSFVVKYKLLIGTFLMSATQATAQVGTKKIPLREGPTCYIVVAMPERANTLLRTTIVDEKSNPLVGVSVSIKGKSDKKYSTVSNKDGSFEIEVLPNDILVFSYLGYQTREIEAIKIPQNTSIVMVEDEILSISCYVLEVKPLKK